MSHDFNRFPELSNNQMQFYYFQSPHRQINEDFWGEVVKITDGDTIHVKWSEREKPVRVRLRNIAAPELNERGGIESASWLKNQIFRQYVQVQINPNLRVGKWGRILGKIINAGIDVNSMSMDMGHSVPFGQVTI